MGYTLSEKELRNKSFRELDQLSTIIERARKRAYKRDRHKIVTRLKLKARKNDRVKFDIANPNIVYKLIRITRDYVYLYRKDAKGIEYEIPISDVTEIRHNGRVVFDLNRELEKIGWLKGSIVQWLEMGPKT